MKKILDFLKKSNKYLKRFFALVVLAIASISLVAIFSGRVNAAGPDDGEIHGMPEPRYEDIFNTTIEDGKILLNGDGVKQEIPAVNNAVKLDNGKSESKKGKPDAGALRERNKAIGKMINSIGSTIAAFIKGGGNTDYGPHVVNLMKSTTNLALTLFSKFPGIGEISDALFDSFVAIVEAFDGSKQSDTKRLMNFIEDQINLVRDDIARTRQDIAELSSKMDEGFENILLALKESFENFEAKTRVNDFFSTSNGAFSYTQLKRYLFSNYTDGYALELSSQIVKVNPNQKRITELQNDLYSSLMSTSTGRTSYLEMFYDNIIQTESHRSIFEYYADFLNSNMQYLSSKSPAVEAGEFMNDVYSTFLTAVNYVRALTEVQRATMFLQIEDVQTVDLDELKYVYGSGQHDYVTFNDLDKVEKRLQEMVDNVDYQISKDIAYVLKLDKTYLYKANDNTLRLSYKTKEETFGNVEKGYTLHFSEINQSFAELFGYNINNFKYYLVDSKGNKLNEGQEDKTTYVVDTDNSFVLNVKYDVLDKSGNPVMTIDSNGNSVPLVYNIYSIPFRVGVTTAFSGGSGKSYDPYIISNVNQFLSIRSLDRHTCYSLITNLDLDGKTVEQMFNDISPYAGTFNGNGFTISNFKIGNSGNQSSIFGYISSTGTITNLTVKNAEVTKNNDNDSTKLDAAIIAGVNNGTISNIIVDSCIVKSIRLSEENSDNVNKSIINYVGTIAAENYGSITYCKVLNSDLYGNSYRKYGANDDGSNSNDVYGGGVVGYNGSNATLSYVSVDSETRIKVYAGSGCDKAFSSRRPYIKAYAGGIAGFVGNTININNLYSGITEITQILVSTEHINDSSWGTSSDKNISEKSSNYIANESAENIKRSSDFEFPQGKTYSINAILSGKIDSTYKIDKALIFNPGTSSFNILEMKFNVKDESSGNVQICNAAVLSVKGFDSSNDSKTEAVRREAEVLVYIEAIKKVVRYVIPYVILPDSPVRVEVIGANITTFDYSTNESDKIVDAKANTTLGTDKINLVLTSGKVIPVGSSALISIDTTTLGDQKAIIKVDNFTDESFEVTVKCANHSWINKTRVVDGYEKIIDEVTHEIYFRLYGYTSRECSICHTIDMIPFNVLCQTELINVVEATCSTLGYTGDKIPYYIDAITHEKVYIDYIVEKGTTIEQLPHTYINENDMGGSHYDDYGHTCSICGHEESHLYSLVENEGIVNGLVYKCEICGHTIVKDNISREDISKMPRVVVDDAYSLAGSHQVVVYVDLHASVGITSANFSIIYDPSLTLVSYRLGNILNDANISRFKVYSDHINVVLAQAATDISTDGTILKLVFETPANASANSRYKIDVVNKGNSDRFTDKNGNKLEFLSYEGYINIVDHLPGDVNGDGLLDMLDVLIVSKYIVLDETEKANYIKEILALNPNLSIGYADVNLDNVIDTDDVVRMLRFDVGGYESQVISQKFIVNLNYNDGSGTIVPYLVDYNYGLGTYGELPQVTKTGYRFDGWYTNIDGTGEKITAVSTVRYNSDQYVQTLYAHWTPNKIIFDNNGGIGQKPSITIYTNSDNMNFSINDKYGNSYITKEATVKFDVNVYDDSLNLEEIYKLNKENTYKQVFLGWSTSKNGNVITNINSVYDLTNFANSQIGTITLYAIWKEIKIDNYLPDTTELPGYNLTGWMLKRNGKTEDIVFKVDATKYTINDSVTLYAKWNLISYNIIYAGNGGKLNSGKNLYFEDDARNSKSNLQLIGIDSIGFTRDGYTFKGWTIDKAFAKTWAYLVEKNYNTIISAFDYKYYDIEYKTVTNSDFVFANEAMLQASATPKPTTTRNINNFITAGLVEDLEEFIDENGFVTLYALWAPNKISITYETSDNVAVLKGTNTLAKDNPVTLPYYYGYDIVLPNDIYEIKSDSDYRRLYSITIPQISSKTYTVDSSMVIYSADLPKENRNAIASVAFDNDSELRKMYIHYSYNGYELFTDRYTGGTGLYFASDLSQMGISKDYYSISSYLSIVDSNGMEGIDYNNNGIISDDEKYITYYHIGDEINSVIRQWPHLDLYIEVQLVGEKKLYDGSTAPLRRNGTMTLTINGSGDFGGIRDNKNKDILIIPDKIRINGGIENINSVDRTALSSACNYYDTSNNRYFKTILFGSGIGSINDLLDDYLTYVEELILPDKLYLAVIATNAPKLKRIVLSNFRDVDLLLLPYTNHSKYIVDIYFRGDLEELNKITDKNSNSIIFDNEYYRIRCYSETKPLISGLPSDMYWYNDNGVIRTWAD